MSRIKFVIWLLLISQVAADSNKFYGYYKRSKTVKTPESPASEKSKKCEEIPTVELVHILGPAYNSRYMSIDPPIVEEDSLPKDPTGTDKRAAAIFNPFYVDDLYSKVISDEPAWKVKDFSESAIEDSTDQESSDFNAKRWRRDNRRRYGMTTAKPQTTRPWECKSKIVWLDLGYDYYPRYLRSVECIQQKCYYSFFTCQPRSFTVKILRRRRGECVQTSTHRVGGSYSVMGVIDEMKELWTWEERAVNFCCDCAAA